MSELKEFLIEYVLPYIVFIFATGLTLIALTKITFWVFS